MKNSKLAGALPALSVGLLIACCGCEYTGAGAASAQTGPQIWNDNCTRCHNVRATTMYSDERWEVALMHMRIRGGLTGSDAKKVLEFMKASN